MAKGFESRGDSSKRPAVEWTKQGHTDGWSAEEALELHRLIAMRPKRSKPSRPDDAASPASKTPVLKGPLGDTPCSRPFGSS
jgi:hypothetical protein